ncbi:hypothetical protein QQS21_004834 [Conoideocrella luteorostrata]|uniref:Heterokaryon incompatibility domain-containing protein n=1 Tax=Conoideocrella luteorostrata TaxID=1105319 RepID=A0AAJ0CTK8_9HYPO|nr:hypothetical protein QQS21_004834 [Conoideocrella luteorostrata]
MAANQSRRRADAYAVRETAEDCLEQNAFSYKPLSTDVDCTRLIEIQPAEFGHTPLSCRLVQYAFKDRPQYEALSYTWGSSGSKKRRIEVNGCFLEIGANLFDALCFLRQQEDKSQNSEEQQSRTCRYWIDALCINQDDILERNRQVAMMGQIYFRATTVVVWLGRKYLRYQDKLSEDKSSSITDDTRAYATGSTEGDQNEDVKNMIAPKGSVEQQEMVKLLCDDQYWTRVWIVQEIGQASQLRVCFGRQAVSWEAFIHLITLHNRNGGPMRLHRLLQERDHDGYTLRKLLQDHQEARCEDPKDKIYGLVGLAADARGFPMDYGRSLINIWTDIMEFVNGRRLLPDSDVISFGKLVKFLLMGATCDPWQQITSKSTIGDVQQRIGLIDDSTTPNDLRVFNIKANVFGQIKYIGPTVSEIVGDLARENEWAMSSQQVFRDDLGAAQRENRMLLRAVLDVNNAELPDLCHNHASSVVWNLRDYHHAVNSYIQRCPLDQNNTVIRDTGSSSDPHLYQAANRRRGQTQWKMGVASRQAEVGDMLCWIKGLRKAAVVSVLRRLNDCTTQLRIVGTAMAAEDMAGNPSKIDRSLPRFTDEMELKMDARTIFVLLA